MYNFISEKAEKTAEEIPFYEDATTVNGWQGQSTGKTIETLKSEIISHIGKLGGIVTGFEKGSFGTRVGFRIHYIIETLEGKHVPGYIDVAALPLKQTRKRQYDKRVSSEATRRDKSLRMALYNVSDCLGALWKLQRLSPGFAPLMPFMLTQSGENLTQLWSSGATMRALMPPADDFENNGNDADIIDGRTINE
ncbi:MAG: hypothetical protein V1775_02245 [Bacteroidota bacterium]